MINFGASEQVKPGWFTVVKPDNELIQGMAQQMVGTKLYEGERKDLADSFIALGIMESVNRQGGEIILVINPEDLEFEEDE